MSSLSDQHRRLILRRFPVFAAAWLGSTAAWIAVLGLSGHADVARVCFIFLAQVVVLAGAAVRLRACRDDKAAVRITVVASALLGIFSIALFASSRLGEILGFVLWSLHLLVALLFSWGWRPQLVLLASTLVPWGLVWTRLDVFTPPEVFATAMAIGSVLVLAIAESGWRSFRVAVLGRESESEVARELAASRDAYRDLAERVPDLIGTFDTAGRFTYLNEALARFLGVSADEAIGRSVRAFTTEHATNDDAAVALEHMLQEARDPPPQRVEVRTPRGPRWVEVAGARMRDGAGRVVGFRGIGRDVTDRMRAEERVRESEARFRSAFGDAPIGMVVLSVDGYVLEVNAAFCRMLGYADERRLLGTSVSDLTHPADRETSLAEIASLTSGATASISLEKRYLRADGGVLWGAISGSVVRGPDGTPTSLIAQVQDISERRRALEALYASETRYRSVVETEQALISRADLEGKVTFANQQLCETIGAPRESILGRRFFEWVPEEDHPAVQGVLASLDAPPRRARVECRLRTVAGDRWIEWEASGVLDGTGGLVEVQSLGRDVTERRRSEAALRESEARYRSLVESQQSAFSRNTLDGRLTFANDFLCAILGGTREELRGRRLFDWVPKEDRSIVAAAFAELEHPPYRVHIENRVKTKSGLRWFEWESCAIRDEDDRLIEIQSIGRDITDRRAAEDALNVSHAELAQREEELRLLAQRQVAVREEERKRVGIDLHDDVCQELVGISILVESVRQQSAKPGEAIDDEVLGRIVKYLKRVVEHLRMLARELRPMLLEQFGLEDSLRSLAEGLSRDGTRIDVDVADPIPRLSETAELAVYRVAQEAVGNALRHAAATQVTVTITVRRDELHLAIEDNGRGFDTAQRSAALGIVSMKERAMALGGSLTVRSKPGEGTTVVLHCPLGDAAPATAA